MLNRSADQKKRYDIDSLTDVALRVFARKGYDGASMDDVAAEAGITKASIYHHVTGKEALLARGLGRALDALFAVLEEREAKTGPAAERLRHLIRRVIDVTTSHLTEVAVLFRVRGNSATELDALERRRRFDRVVAELVTRAQADGAVRDDLDPHLMTRLVFGMTNSLVEWYRPEGAIGAAAITTAVSRIVFDGLTPR